MPSSVNIPAGQCALLGGTSTVYTPVYTWQIFLGGTSIATSSVPNGWSATSGAGSSTVCVPNSATITTGYYAQWLYGSSIYQSGTFGVTVGDQPGTTNPYTFTGSVINETGSAYLMLQARVHRRAKNTETTCELWFLKGGSWVQYAPLMTKGQHPVLVRAWDTPAKLEFQLSDNFANLSTNNITSSWNQTSGSYDPLITDSRQVVLRVGTYCYANLLNGLTATASQAPSTGALSYLTDDILVDFTATTQPSAAAYFSITGSANLVLTFDTGSSQPIMHAVCRFATGQWGALPASMQMSVSNDNITFVNVNDAVHGGGTGGDWDDAYLNDSTDPQVNELISTDLNVIARYVRFTIVPQTATQTIAIDELAVYGSAATTIYGTNIFTGYLGDQMDYSPEGYWVCSATDVLRKLADNNECRLTPPFGNVDVADICYALATGTAYWSGTGWQNNGTGTTYDTPFTSAFIGWTSGTNYTGLTMPVWQGQGNNILGYMAELWHEVGWIMQADGNGKLIAYGLPYRQMRPTRVLVNGQGGNSDVRNAIRTGTGKDIRNVVEMTTGKAVYGNNTLAQTYSDPNSVATFGHRRMIITDPLAVTADLQANIASAILRDYAWRQWQLTAEIAPGYETKLKDIHAFRTDYRVHLASKTSTDYAQEMWALDRIEEHITPGQWYAQATYSTYRPTVLEPPIPNNIASVGSASPYSVTLTWNAYTSIAGLQGFYVYYSTTGVNGPWTKANPGSPVGVSGTSYTFGSFAGGATVYAYVTAEDIYGHESIPSQIMPVVAGGSAVGVSGWEVTDLASGGITKYAVTRGGVAGYTYEFTFTFTSPAQGFRGSFFRYATTLPSSPADYRNWTYLPGTNVNHVYVPAGSVGTGSNEYSPPWTSGQLFQYIRIWLPGNPSGNTLYLRMFTYFGSWWPGSNVISVTLP